MTKDTVMETEENKTKKKGKGRPTDYKDEYVEQVRKLCELGATDEEVADFFEVDVRTIYRWKLKYEEFCQALKIGKSYSDDRVERSLYQKAIGYYVTEEQVVKVKTGSNQEEVKVVEVQRFVPPDTTAMIYWTKNRKKDEWRDRVEHTGDNGKPLASGVNVAVLADKDLNALAKLLDKASSEQS